VINRHECNNQHIDEWTKPEQLSNRQNSNRENTIIGPINRCISRNPKTTYFCWARSHPIAAWFTENTQFLLWIRTFIHPNLLIRYFFSTRIVESVRRIFSLISIPNSPIYPIAPWFKNEWMPRREWYVCRGLDLGSLVVGWDAGERELRKRKNDWWYIALHGIFFTHPHFHTHKLLFSSSFSLKRLGIESRLGRKQE